MVLDPRSVDVFVLWTVDHHLCDSSSGEVRYPLVCCLAQMGTPHGPHTHVLYFCVSGEAELCHWFCQEIS